MTQVMNELGHRLTVNLLSCNSALITVYSSYIEVHVKIKTRNNNAGYLIQ